MRPLLILLGVAVLVLLAALAFGFINVDQTQTAQLPRVEGGQLPEFDADVGSVDVGTQNTTVAVPTVEVEEKKVTVPTIDVEKAN